MSRTRTLGRAVRAVAYAAVISTVVAGCHFARPPATQVGAPTPRPSHSFNPVATRLLDAPALLTQCIVDRGVLRPQGQGSWFSNGRVKINSGNAQDFAAWWHAFFTPGPYKQTFLIDGRRTHYLAFGAHWTSLGGQWVPLHRNRNDPLSQRTSLYAWSLWTASHQTLPAVVCGPDTSARQLQTEIFGSQLPNPWAS